MTLNEIKLMISEKLDPEDIELQRIFTEIAEAKEHHTISNEKMDQLIDDVTSSTIINSNIEQLRGKIYFQELLNLINILRAWVPL